MFNYEDSDMEPTQVSSHPPGKQLETPKESKFICKTNTHRSETVSVNLLKVPKCEILMSWILMIFYHEVYIGRGLEG
jgi:hypothetical protein